MYKYMFVILLLCISSSAYTQDINTSLSWKKKVKVAEEMATNGNYAEAAMYYRSAWNDKKEKTELAYKAGQNFFKARDYKMAAKAYEPVKDFNSKYPNVGYKYAMSMKNFGRYKSAMTAFEKFRSAADPAPAMRAAINQHIEGCKLGQSLKDDNTPIALQAKHAGNTLNSSKREFAPIPHGANGLYFSSTSKGGAKIFSSNDRGNGQWNSPIPASFVRNPEKLHYGNGSFSADQEKFYFTQCDISEQGASLCNIYLLQKKGGLWQAAVRLPDHINEAGTNTTHPCLVIDGETEYLYFSSNRLEGQGGMDLWYVSKNINEDLEKFTLPNNLGRSINTMGDDITPFYDAVNKKLYFSSDGQISIGGFDVYVAEGEKSSWTGMQNMKYPVNSSYDDMYYTIRPGTNTSYMVSNRLQEESKESSLDDDIFVVSERTAEIFVRGNISSEGDPVQKVDMSLYKKNEADNMRKILGQVATDGTYSFQLQPNQSYRLKVAKDGYQESEFEFITEDPSATQEINHDFDLEKVSKPIAKTPKPPVVSTPAKVVEEVISQPSKVQLAEKIMEVPAVTQPTPPVVIAQPVQETVVETLEETIVQVPEQAVIQETVLETLDETIVQVPEQTAVQETVVETLDQTIVQIPEQAATEMRESTPLPETPSETLSITSAPRPGLGKGDARVEIKEDATPSVQIISEDIPTTTITESLVESGPTPIPTVGTIVDTPPVFVTEPEVVTYPTTTYTSSPVTTTYPTYAETTTYDTYPSTTSEYTDNTYTESYSNTTSYSSTPSIGYGTEYRVQLAALKDYKDHKFQKIRNLGNVILEGTETPLGYLTRVMIDGFTSKRDAKQVMEQAKSLGFDRAFVIKYKDGMRTNQMSR